MPSLKRTINGSSYVSDPFDQIEEGNRNSALDSAWRGASMRQGQQQNDMMTQLALQKLRSDDYHFGQSRADNMAMFREGLGAQNHTTDVMAGLQREGMGLQKDLYGKQFDYQSGRDSLEDAFRNKSFDYATNSDLNPDLKMHRDLESSQADLAKYKLAQMKADAERASTAGNNVVFTPKDDQERETYQGDIAAGMAPAVATIDVKNQGRTRAMSGADTMAEDLARGFQRFNKKDTAFFSGDPTQGEMSALESQFGQLVKRYTDAGLAPEDAKQKARNVIEKAGLGSEQGGDYETDAFSDKTSLLLRHLGMR